MGFSLAQNSNPHFYPNYQSNREFWTLNGHTADPCVNREELYGGLPPSSSVIVNNNNNALGTTAPKTDCSGLQLPDPSVTILIPSSGSVTPTGGWNFALTMTGRNLALGSATGGTPSVALSFPGGACATIDTTTIVAGTFSGSNFLFTVPASWTSPMKEFEILPRKICYNAAAGVDPLYVQTGFKAGIVWDCDDTVTGRRCVDFVNPVVNPFPTTILSARELAIRYQRTKCIRHTIADHSGANVPLMVGQCINTNVASGCQGAAIDPISMKCCDSNLTLVQTINRPCLCRPDGSSSSPTCPTVESNCCTHTKYPELSPLYNSVGRGAWPEYYGECYNTTTHRCCDTGYRYDPGQDQCCNITGIQSLNSPCPCQSDSDCQGGQTLPGQGSSYGTDTTMYCCSLFWPDPYETGDSIISKIGAKTTYPRCNKYNNYPSTDFQSTNYPIATGPYQAQRCLGTCIDNRYQTCCNGVACHREFEVCCNSTCCNKFTSTCTEGRIPGTPNNRFNYNELDQPYEICTSIEVLNPLRGFWLYVWPAYLLLMTAVCTAFAVVFINKVSRRSFSFLERAMITIAFFTIIFACACYFAPIYKYGVFVVIVNIFTIITASARSKSLNLTLVIVQFITIMYLFDPFTGNNYLGFSAIRVANGDPDPESAGILYSIMKCFHTLTSFNSQQYCVNYYNYFNKDPNLEDFRRDNMSVPSFGYCGHGWITALYIFEGITIILTLLQFLLDLIALILRYKEERTEEFIRLEPEAVEFTPTTAAVPVVPVSVSPAMPYFPTGFTTAPIS